MSARVSAVRSWHPLFLSHGLGLTHPWLQGFPAVMALLMAAASSATPSPSNSSVSARFQVCDSGPHSFEEISSCQRTPCPIVADVSEDGIVGLCKRSNASIYSHVSKALRLSARRNPYAVYLPSSTHQPLMSGRRWPRAVQRHALQMRLLESTQQLVRVKTTRRKLKWTGRLRLSEHGKMQDWYSPVQALISTHEVGNIP